MDIKKWDLAVRGTHQLHDSLHNIGCYVIQCREYKQTGYMLLQWSKRQSLAKLRLSLVTGVVTAAAAATTTAAPTTPAMAATLQQCRQPHRLRIPTSHINIPSLYYDLCHTENGRSGEGKQDR
jgi:hypothetical protein